MKLSNSENNILIPEKNKSDKIIAIAGNPNVGKSTLFNALTGLKQHTGNWPGKTVSNATGEYIHKNQKFKLVDIPGTYSIMANSIEEEIARDFICFGKPDTVIVVMDATCIEDMGMKFGLWFEPEMVNKDSDLFRAHPDWILQVPGRKSCHGRYQYVLDFSRKEVVDCIYKMMEKILSEAKVSYIKWDMNRSITECWSAAFPADRQGEIFHRYILGVYDLYERLINKFPHILFESCASGGARFDPGMLYYAPQAWTSDDTDAAERLKIQYGTSYCYPVSSMGSHVSTTPNHQTGRNTPLHTRANVACFGTFGYELDLNTLTQEEQDTVKEQITFMKKYRHILQFGTFYRLSSPFENNVTSWMVVSADKKEAIVGWYRVLSGSNLPFGRLRLQGLDEGTRYLFTTS